MSERTSPASKLLEHYGLKRGDAVSVLVGGEWLPGTVDGTTCVGTPWVKLASPLPLGNGAFMNRVHACKAMLEHRHV